VGKSVTETTSAQQVHGWSGVERLVKGLRSRKRVHRYLVFLLFAAASELFALCFQLARPSREHSKDHGKQRRTFRPLPSG